MMCRRGRFAGRTWELPGGSPYFSKTKFPAGPGPRGAWRCGDSARDGQVADAFLEGACFPCAGRLDCLFWALACRARSRGVVAPSGFALADFACGVALAGSARAVETWAAT